MKKKIAITGAKGVIGSVMTEGLNDIYKITPLNLPDTDVKDYQKLLNIFPGHSAIIHLAWATKIDNSRSGDMYPENVEMFHNVFKAALESGVPRVIMASSVHADAFDKWKESDKISPNRIPIPDSPYGTLKVEMEAMGRYYATKGLQVAYVRFGGINPQNKPAIEPTYERAVWFSHNDCVSLIKAILEANNIPDNFVVMYGMSDNPGRIHDVSNPFGWKPKDSAIDI
ncbi:MAG TPA: NAD(P)-dependent oxidoreductase [Patescibacteria group bacterium]|nr:NAD(P)-dependent oxidoreductase [Patescibacteria group bacterium]